MAAAKIHFDIPYSSRGFIMSKTQHGENTVSNEYWAAAGKLAGRLIPKPPDDCVASDHAHRAIAVRYLNVV
jgi:hypothetical protein